MKECSSIFYGSLKKDMRKSEHKYKELFEEVVKMLPEDKNSAIIDLGCGIGSLVPYLSAAGYKNYLGIDFSSELTLEASLRFPEYRFITDNINSKVISKLIDKHSVVICLEVLEHLTEDLDLVKRISIGKTFIFSVPTVMSKGHVRCFNSHNEVVLRYTALLDFKEKKTIMKLGKPHHLMFLSKTVRKQ